MFKVNNINGEYLDITDGPSRVLGTALHKAMQAYTGGLDDIPTPVDDGEAIKFGFDYGKAWLDEHHDGFIKFNTIIENRTQLEEAYSRVFFGYIKEFNLNARTKEVIMAEKMLTYHAEATDDKYLPIPLKGAADLVYRDELGRVVIYDYKITSVYSKEDEVDGDKLVQAVFLYFLHKAHLKEVPYKIVYGEYKISKNKDGSPQLREFEFIYEDHPLMFDLFYRYYSDVTRALLGEQVFVPNLQAMYDREVAILAYVNYLDVDIIREEAFKKAKVSNITDFLKRKIQKDSTMKRYMKTVTSKFISAQTLNYKTMQLQDRIKMKLAEHGISVNYVDKVTGNAVELYRFEPSIGVKMARLDDYVRDVEQVTAKVGIRVLAPIPGTDLIGFELPLETRTFPGKPPATDGFNVALGVDILGRIIRMDFRKQPHVLMGGASGAGKSTTIDVVISQLSELPNVDLVLLDPKMVELSKWKSRACAYSDDPVEIATLLNGAVVTMNTRYAELQKKGLRSVEGTKMSYIFIIVDEYGDLVMSKQKMVIGNKKSKKMYADGEREMTQEVEDTAGNVVAEAIKKLAQKGRAAGIHIILTTQRPSVKVIDGDIKANFPTRIAFRTASATDSQVILDQTGAEKLLGSGDMLISDVNGVTRVQGYSL